LNDKRKWVIFSYRIPGEPSTVRVRVWRTLKSIGAFYLQQSVCILPFIPDIQKKIVQLQNLIIDNHGEVTLLEVEQFSNFTEEQVIALFNQQREIEFNEFIEGCNAFLKEIEEETSSGNFSYHEIEENEAELVRLKRWHRKIMKRDFFPTEFSKKCHNKLDECEASMQNFICKVYKAEGNKEGELL